MAINYKHNTCVKGDMLGKNIMIVDDNNLIGRVMKRHLEKFVRGVAIATTGGISVEPLKQGYFDVVILDINLLGMSGWGVFAKIRKLSPETKVKIITASGMEDNQALALRRGAFDLIPKPFYLRRLDHVSLRILPILFHKSS